MSESFHELEHNPLVEARTYDSFDSWLTQIPDEQLRHLGEVGVQACSDEGTNDTETLTALVGIAMLFSGKTVMSISEVAQAFRTLTTYMTTESHVRAGSATKKGVYSLFPEEDTAMITLTEKGQQMYGQMRNQ